MSDKKQFGDWQTPGTFADSVTRRVLKLGINPESVLEPTCGTGSFVAATLVNFPNAKRVVGLEINPEYIAKARRLTQHIDTESELKLEVADFFQVDWERELSDLPGQILVIGNLPWVTNSVQGTLGTGNLPEKSNVHGLSGFEARTGKANFDISEWMVLELLKTLMYRDATIALLMKTSVARKLISFGESQGLPIVEAQMVRVDAMKHFEAAVDACLFVLRLKPGNRVDTYDYKVFSGLEDHEGTLVGHRDGNLVSDIDAYLKHKALGTGSPDKWRSGIKHDCSSVMELSVAGQSLINGLGEVVDVESEYLYPLMKGSDVGNRRAWRGKYVIVTQKSVGEETQHLESSAPKLWNYLNTHAEKLDGRKSSIYIKNPRFSIFGVGNYSFRPFKIAICGLYKKLSFELFEPVDGKPVMFDDTVYFLGFDSLAEAKLVYERLSERSAQEFLASLIFWDEKRPIKTSILNQFDWRKA